LNFLPDMFPSGNEARARFARGAEAQSPSVSNSVFMFSPRLRVSARDLKSIA
jgi:hypothetical protein